MTYVGIDMSPSQDLDGTLAAHHEARQLDRVDGDVKRYSASCLFRPAMRWTMREGNNREAHKGSVGDQLNGKPW